ncbi:hypothetical protein AA0481_0765 [Acetobacter orientalis NRIC 0481]|nr:hypothetical protein AA0481_0765 [Acetobacter orientalis NRIC 0481]
MQVGYGVFYIGKAFTPCGGNTRSVANFFGKAFAALKARCGLGGASAGDVGLGAGICQARYQGGFGAGYNQVYGLLFGKGNKGRYVFGANGYVYAVLCRAGVTRRYKKRRKMG